MPREDFTLSLAQGSGSGMEQEVSAMKVDCVYSPVCQMWINHICDNGGYYIHLCRNCEHYLERRELVKSITGYTPIVKKFIESE